ncbi:hypothetical protein PTNB73_01717 [Pyrenophora teres f. teres]|nr:hypothetical protein HRS9139_00304 [Pyrenophora teres f. teres]KAE8847876.1 hypothetical protein PTNB85_01719 [Pyrenophora teres f. teres]KAE8867803.1 hypothetical protein PTNB29_01714 [Pyrenophora teres f. teres]KAE8872566.1 hypothetical protein PTNB73_01717 [Pyrenophora teres f. teres]
MKSLLLPLILTLATTALTAAIASPLDTASPLAVRDATCNVCFAQYNFCTRVSSTASSATTPETMVLDHFTHTNDIPSPRRTDIHKVKKAASRPAPSTSAM